MHHAPGLLDKLTLNTLATGIALIQGSPVSFNKDAGRGLRHSHQFNYLLDDNGVDGSPHSLAAAVYRLTCRTNFAAPGFALIQQHRVDSSLAQRQSMIELKENLSLMHQALFNHPIGWFSLSRGDQRQSSQLHREGGPPQSLLLIGLEPSQFNCDLWVADYSACSHELGLSPVQFLEEFNSTGQKDMKHLAPYVMPVVEFNPQIYNLLVINNSCAALNHEEQNWQGLLHSCEISRRSNKKSKGRPERIINQAIIMPLTDGAEDTHAEADLKLFI